jgi:hypothetical protein
MRQALKIVGIAAVISAASVADAHHSYAMFDLNRVATVQGTVKVVEWTNPHVWLWISQTHSTGAGTYAFETVSPGELARFYGWNRTSLGIGQKVTVEFAPLRSGKNGGAVRKITLANGQSLQTPLSHLPAGGPPPPGSTDAKH